MTNARYYCLPVSKLVLPLDCVYGLCKEAGVFCNESLRGGCDGAVGLSLVKDSIVISDAIAQRVW